MNPTEKRGARIDAGADASKKSPDPASTIPGADRGVRRVRAVEVLGPRGILQIEHEGEVYILRVTRNNRLILTK